MIAQDKNEDVFLLNGLKTGSEDAFKSLFEKYSKRLYHVAFHYLNNKEESEEIVQEVFYKVWLNHKSIKPELHFIPYLIRIAKNILINQSKRKLIENTYVQSLEKNIDYKNRQTDNHIMFNEVSEIVRGFVQNFPSKRKEIFVLSRYEGLSNREIALKQKISERTVENHINKGLKTLKEKLNTYGYLSILFIILHFSG